MLSLEFICLCKTKFDENFENFADNIKGNIENRHTKRVDLSTLLYNIIEENDNTKKILTLRNDLAHTTCKPIILMSKENKDLSEYVKIAENIITDVRNNVIASGCEQG
jgi:hypothetical protein